MKNKNLPIYLAIGLFFLLVLFNRFKEEYSIGNTGRNINLPPTPGPTARPITNPPTSRPPTPRFATTTTRGPIVPIMNIPRY